MNLRKGETMKPIEIYISDEVIKVEWRAWAQKVVIFHGEGYTKEIEMSPEDFKVFASGLKAFAARLPK